MEALLLVAGAALAFAASLVLQREERRTTTRSRVYLDLLPELHLRATLYNRIARQNPRSGPLWYLKEGDWPLTTEADAIHRHAMLLTPTDVEYATRIRDRWMAFARRVHPEDGDLNEVVVGDATTAEAAKAVMDSIDAYSAWIEQRNLGRRHPARST